MWCYIPKNLNVVTARSLWWPVCVETTSHAPRTALSELSPMNPGTLNWEYVIVEEKGGQLTSFFRHAAFTDQLKQPQSVCLIKSSSETSCETLLWLHKISLFWFKVTEHQLLSREKPEDLARMFNPSSWERYMRRAEAKRLSVCWWIFMQPVWFQNIVCWKVNGWDNNDPNVRHPDPKKQSADEIQNKSPIKHWQACA